MLKKLLKLVRKNLCMKKAPVDAGAAKEISHLDCTIDLVKVELLMGCGMKCNPKSSKPDSRGKWFIDCAECAEGENGDKSYSAGHDHKQIRKGGCFSGQLLEKFTNKRERGKEKCQSTNLSLKNSLRN